MDSAYPRRLPYGRIRNSVCAVSALASLTLAWPSARGAPSVRADGLRQAVTGTEYRLTLGQDTTDLALELRRPDGAWEPVASPSSLTFGILSAETVWTTHGLPVLWDRTSLLDTEVFAGQVLLDPLSGVRLDLHLICAAEGILIGARVVGAPGGAGSLWSPPRLALPAAAWDRYAFWAEDGQYHQGRIADLAPRPAYAGVSPWGERGDTTPALARQTPGLVVRSSSRGIGLGVVLVDSAAWASSAAFLQAHTGADLYVYCGYTPLDRVGPGCRWAWLAPFAAGDAAADRARVGALLARSQAVLTAYVPRPLRPAPGAAPVPEFPAHLQRQAPVADIGDAVIYTINEGTRSEYGLNLARKVGSEVLIRAWFKWREAPAVDRWRAMPAQAHAQGALFGGGITCSALYDSENGITTSQLHDMATRGPDGELVDAWDQPGLRHGSLSSPAYRDYLFRWCREQIDAGADYLFMDEHTAALSEREGYDDHSLRDFRTFLIEEAALTRGWAGDDPRWRDQCGIDRADRTLCPDGTLASFDYRAYLRARDLLQKPLVAANPLAGTWADFRRWRDDRAWKDLTDRIRAYAAARQRRVLISANGIAPYVDMQVLGVWGKWRLADGHIDVSENQLPYWRSLVVSGRQAVGGRPVPVVLFHDWGFGEPPFPWLAAPASEREVWMRTRGAEIYAAGAFFAFPVLGPFGCDAGRDGTLATIARQTAFYAAHRDLFLHSRWLGCERLSSEAPLLSLASSWQGDSKALVVHVINRDVRAGVLQERAGPIVVRLPLGAAPVTAVAISPDHDGERPVEVKAGAGEVTIVLPGLEAYTMVLLRYAETPDLAALADPARIWLPKRWSRPTRAQFRVLPGGLVDGAGGLEGFLQGRLHTHLRNPPEFRLKAVGGAEMRLHVCSVATAGARIEVRIDDGAVQAVDLPDLDGENRDTGEYNRVLTFPVPPGRHRVRLDNTGGDWVVIDWIEFVGEFSD